MILAEAPRPNRPKKDESVLHMMSFFCVLLRVFDAFCVAPGGLSLLHRGALVVHLSAFDAAFLLGIPIGQRTWSDVRMHLILRHTIVWNATAGLPCLMKQDRWAAMKPWV